MVELQTLETQLAELEDPPRDPASIRFTRAMVARKDPSRAEESQRILQSLLVDYPDSQLGPRTLLALASTAADRGDVDGAVSYLNEIRDAFEHVDPLVAEAMLLKGRILERDGQWSEALLVFRVLGMEYPMTEAGLRAPLEIVDHYERAGDHGRAAETYRAAGDIEAAARCFEAAYDWDNALECYRELDDLEKQSEILEKTGEYLDAAEIARQIGDDDRAIRNLYHVGHREHNHGLISQALGHFHSL